VSDNVYIHDGNLIIAGGSTPTGHGGGPLHSIERVRNEGRAFIVEGAHSAFRHSSSTFYLRLDQSGIAIANNGNFIAEKALVLGQVSSDFVGSSGGAVLLLDSRMNRVDLSGGGYTAYGGNVIPAGFTVFGAGTAFEIGTNVCGTDTTCP
jgi:hypothetical protein